MKKNLMYLVAFFSSAVCANQQVLVLSGGDDPGLNHYSQYLQTKALYEHLLTRFEPSTVSLYFGGGNNLTTEVLPFDVHQLIGSEENKQDKMLTGIIANNQQANKPNVSAYFLSDKIQKSSAKDSFYLFVSDHGMPHGFLEDKSANQYGNNCIDLWHYQKPFINNFTDAQNFSNTCLSKNELSSLLSLIPSQHVVFVMSQCYSGGFHQLSVVSKEGYPTANPAICGFTSATDDHYASGCTADANGDTYQGYERSFTEWYTGLSVIDGKKIREPAKTILAAHQSAILEDMTVDIPLSTSDYYLLQWAKLFASKHPKSRLSQYDGEKIKTIFLNYKKELFSIKNQNLAQFIQLAKDSESKIIQQMPEAKDFTSLSLEEQKQKINALEERIEEQGIELETIWDGMMNLSLQVILPSWKIALEQSNTSVLNEKQNRFEKELYQALVEQHLYQHPYQFDMYYLQYLSAKQNDPDLIAYHKDRNGIILDWALKNKNDSLGNAIKSFEVLDKKQLALVKLIAEQEKEKQWLKRVYTYNQIIAAWVTLLTIKDKQTLDELEGLLNCQRSS
jgi:hypothetical protein